MTEEERLKRNAYMREWHARHPGRKAEYSAKFKRENPDAYKAYQQRHRRKLKAEVLGHYGGICTCCGEIELMFLTIDHVNGDGAEHRRTVGDGTGFCGAEMYRWLRRNGYPDGFQVLCANCNCGKQWNGGTCPHQISGARER